jgi:hypothetical protein
MFPEASRSHLRGEASDDVEGPDVAGPHGKLDLVVEAFEF